MLANLRDHLWGSDDDWSFEQIHRKAVWLACCLSYDRGPRLGNLTLKNGRTAIDHNIRCSSVSFLVDQPAGQRRVAAGSAMQSVGDSQVVSMTIEIVTSKTTGGGKALKILPAVISRHTAESSQLLIDFARFVRKSGSERDQPLLSFYRESPKTRKRMHKILTRKDINQEIKACAIRCGLPASFFSATSCLRKDHAIQTTRSWMWAQERNVAGGWAVNSKVPDRHYDQSRPRVHGALDAAASNGSRSMNVEHLRALVPLT